MIIATSLSPGHANSDNQQAAINSWQKYGACFSINTGLEIGDLSEKYTGVKFIGTSNTIEAYAKKPLVNINEFFSLAANIGDDLLLVNSDIILHDMPEMKQDGITIFSRYDYTNNIENGKIFKAGFDVFYIPKQFLTSFPPSVYALGMAWFDYWIPYHCMTTGIPVYYAKGKHAFHKLHQTQYSYENWIKFGEFFRWQFGLNGRTGIQIIASNTLTAIKSKLII